MIWVPTDKEIAAVLQLDGPERYSYLVKKVADQQMIWSLCKADGWALVGDDLGRQLVPVWPHETFAESCAQDRWAGYLPKGIEIDTWIERWVPGMLRDAKLVAVFPTPGDRGVAVDPAAFSEDLQEELSQYE